jgi:ABC-type transport system involved in multi-copper enzyme maturation permease subunit
MKFLAILRDSLREALDTKVIYFLFGLSALVILAVGSISFVAEPPQKGLEAILKRIPGAQGNGRQRTPIDVTLENFEQTNDTTRAWEGEYRYDLVVTEADLTKQGQGEEGDKPKRPAPAAKQPSPFRMIVLMTTLMGKRDDELSDEDRKLKAKIGSIVLEVARSGGNPNSKQMEKAAESLVRELDNLEDERLEEWVKRQLAASSAMEVTRVSLEMQGGGQYRFRVESKAGPDTVRTWPHSLVLFFGGLTLPINVGVGAVVYGIEDFLVAGFGAGLTMLLSTIITAFFIPNMLRKGTVDLLIAKPVGRTMLLVSKYVGGLTFMFINTVVIVVGIWLVLGLRSGLWGTGFLLSIFILTFQFAIFYAFSVLLGVLTRSPIVSILGTCALWFLLFGVGLAVSIIKPLHDMKVTPDWAWATANGFRVALPRYKDLDRLDAQLIAGDLLAKESNERRTLDRDVEEIRWAESLGVTVGYIALFVGLACWRFNVKDY